MKSNGASSVDSFPNSGFSFIATHISPDVAPFEFLPGVVLRRATRAEVVTIKSRLFTGSSGLTGWSWPAYDSIITSKKGEIEGVAYSYEELSERDWNYWVLAFEGNNAVIAPVERVCALLEVDLDFATTILFKGASQQDGVMAFLSSPLHVTHLYDGPLEHLTLPAKFHAKTLTAVADIIERERTATGRYEFIQYAFNTFLSTKVLKGHDGLKCIGYFSVLEALMTHQPRSNETLDSIGHQLRNKAVLLEKKFSRRLKASEYFEALDDLKVWKKLYDYRSCVAHGTAVDFSHKFAVLKNAKAINGFLKEFTKELILLSFSEAEFVADLREC